jgi:hypothetical protein
MKEVNVKRDYLREDSHVVRTQEEGSVVCGQCVVYTLESKRTLIPLNDRTAATNFLPPLPGRSSKCGAHRNRTEVQAAVSVKLLPAGIVHRGRQSMS